MYNWDYTQGDLKFLQGLMDSGMSYIEATSILHQAHEDHKDDGGE